jgi:protein gp37
MTAATKIEWADSTFNPWEGCTKVGPGCDHCYAEGRNARFGGGVAPNWGPGAPRRRTSRANWQLPVKWNGLKFLQCTCCPWRGEERAWQENGGMCPGCGRGEVCDTMLRARRRVFCASLADVFDNEVDPSWRRDLFWLIVETPELDWLLVTKRVGNVAAMVAEALDGPPPPTNWPFPRQAPARLPRNVWLLITVVNQAEAQRDIPKLLAIDAAVRGLSIEPMLGRVDLTRLHVGRNHGIPNVQPGHDHVDALRIKPGIDWVIAGGESGPDARPANPNWFRFLRDQCADAGIAYLHKQNGEWAPGSNWPDDVAIPSGEHCDFDGELKGDDQAVWRVGKKRAGRLLDGIEHNGYPRATR